MRQEATGSSVFVILLQCVAKRLAESYEIFAVTKDFQKFLAVTITRE